MKSIIIEANMTRYDLLYGEHAHPRHDWAVCTFIWLKNGVAGPALTWDKGSHLYASYVTEKADINCADLTGILSAIKHHFPGSVGGMHGFNPDYMYRGA